jgi:hypothetical protein
MQRTPILILAAALTATPVAIAQQAASADVKDLARHPDNYLNKTVTVEGEVADVLGPHLFVIDAPKLFHLWGGMAVVVPEPAAAVIRRDSPVRVTGAVQKVVLAEAKRKWPFLSRDPQIEVDMFEKPVLVANEVTTVAPAIVSLKVGPEHPVGTSGSNGAPITDAKQLAAANDSSLVGRRAQISGTVSRMQDDGFWVKAPSGEEVFVEPADKASVRQGQTVEIRGTVLESSRAMKNQKGGPTVYVYADQVTPK